MEYFIGIDLHKKFFTYHATDKEGEEIVKGKYDNSLENVSELLSFFPIKPKIVVEATGHWMWFVRFLKGQGCLVTLAHPLKVRAIASSMIKTDSVDAKILCHLLRSNLVPSSYIATEEEQDNRELSRGRMSLVHDRTQLKNRIHAILTKENLKFEGSDMFGVKGKVWIKEQILSVAKRYMAETYLKKLSEIEESIKDIDEQINKKSSGVPEVSLLKTIPGIGTTTAFLLAAEIGDITRFPTSKQFASYFGLVPRLSQSGSHAYYGRITRLGNPYVRWALSQAAQRIARYDRQSKRFIERLSYRAGKKKALVALSRELATIIFCVLREKRAYIKDFKRSQMVCPAIISEQS